MIFPPNGGDSDLAATLAGLPPQIRWSSLTQAERDLAYDNTAAVQDSAALIAARNTAAAAFREAHAAHLDLPYGPDPRHRLDLYGTPAPGAPCFVFIHGGYWQWNSRELFAHLAEGLVALGWTVVMPSYRLAPQASLEGIVADVSLALDWVAHEGAGRGISGPVILSGWSAGGHLTAMLLGHARVAAGLAISGVFELAPIRDTYLNAALRLSPEEVATLSPLRLPPCPKPLVIAYGADELAALVHDSQSLHAQRVAAGVPGSLLPLPGRKPLHDHRPAAPARQPIAARRAGVGRSLRAWSATYRGAVLKKGLVESVARPRGIEPLFSP